MSVNLGFETDDDVALKSVVKVSGLDQFDSSNVTTYRKDGKWTSKIIRPSSPDDRRTKSRGLDATVASSSSSSSQASTVDAEEIRDTHVSASKPPSELSSSSSSVGSGESIAVLGSGDFGRALAARLVQAGYGVQVGSRDPQRNAELVTKLGARPRFHDEALRSARVAVVAVPKRVYPDLPLEQLSGKIVIDCSNRDTTKAKMEISQAEYLQTLVPEASVVKAFNVLSAYALENGARQGSQEVPLAGDDQAAKESVSAVIRACGFTPFDKGSLRASREIEDIPVQRFSSWKSPLIISSAIFLLLFLVTFAKSQVCWTLTWGDGSWHWERWHFIPVDTLNKTISCHALTMLATCYLPGVIAGYIQLIRGTKYSRFPNWLDRWLRMRKQLGLLMLFSACIHACLSVAILSPLYHGLVYGDATSVHTDTLEGEGWGPKTLVQNQTVEVFTSNNKMKWRGELFLTCGVVSFAFAIVLGITSLPSVSASMTWKEFAFVQSKLGWLCLLLACAHNLLYGWPYLNAPSCYIPSSFQYVMYLPGLLIVLKLPLLLPCVSSHLNKIRSGFERGKSSKFLKEQQQA